MYTKDYKHYPYSNRESTYVRMYCRYLFMLPVIPQTQSHKNTMEAQYKESLTVNFCVK
jgi:hypothetical protein